MAVLIARQQLNAFSFPLLTIYPFWHHFRMPLTIHTGNKSVVYFAVCYDCSKHSQPPAAETANTLVLQEPCWVYNNPPTRAPLIIVVSKDTLPQEGVGTLNVLVTRASILYTTWVHGWVNLWPSPHKQNGQISWVNPPRLSKQGVGKHAGTKASAGRGEKHGARPSHLQDVRPELGYFKNISHKFEFPINATILLTCQHLDMSQNVN